MEDAAYEAWLEAQTEAMDSFNNPVRYDVVADAGEQSSVGDY